jgi:gamma-glutamyltranspeptidase/glutathione hydrolase
MAPTIVLEDGRPVLLIGSPGGSRIIPYVAETLVRILDFGQDPQVAIDGPHVVNRNGPTEVEAGPDAAATVEALAVFGAAPETAALTSGLHAILIRPDGTLVGGADKRREGLVMGE